MSAEVDPEVAGEWQSLVDSIKASVPDFFAGRRGDVEFRVSEKGRPVLHYDGMVIFADRWTGEPIAARARGANVEYGAFTDDGLVWATPPLGDPGAN